MSTGLLTAPDDDLGPVIVSCRRLPRLRAFALLEFRPGTSWFHFVQVRLAYFLFLPLLLPLIPFIPVGWILNICGYDIKDIDRGLLRGLVLLSCPVAWWILYLLPGYDYFVLHENGLRIRIGFRRLRARFDSLIDVCSAIPDELIEAEYERLGRYYDREPDEHPAPRLASGSVAIELADGRTRTFRALHRFEPADVARLLVALRHVHDEWWPEPDA